MNTINNNIHFGAAERNGDLYVFPVKKDWDGYRFLGYFRPTTDEVVAYYGSAEEAAQEWANRYGTDD